MSTDRSADLEARLEEMTAAYEAVVAEKRDLQARHEAETTTLTAQFEAEKTRLQALYDDLAAQYETLKRRFFGRSSEKQTVDDQPQLFDEPAGEQPDDIASDSDDETSTVRPHTRKKRGRKPLPDNIEREEIVLDIPEEDKHCG